MEREPCVITSGRQRVDRRGGTRSLLLTNFTLISLKSAEQRAVLKSLDKKSRDSSSGTAPVCHITMHMAKSPRPSPSVFAYRKQSGENGLGMRLLFTMITVYLSHAGTIWISVPAQHLIFQAFRSTGTPGVSL